MIQDYTQYVSGNEFLNKNADVKNAETDFDYHSFYRAIVTNNQDPERLGRIKVQIPTRGSNDVWAYPGLFSGMGFQTGSMLIPPINSIVYVTFEYSDDHRLIYFGGIPTKYSNGKSQNYGPFINGGNDVTVNDNDIALEFTGTQQIIYKSPQGNIIYIDDDDAKNSIIISNLFGQQFKIAREFNSSDDTTDNYIEMVYDENNYIKLKEGSIEMVSGGRDVASQKYVGDITGDGVSQSFIITHNLGTRDVIVQIYNASTYEEVHASNIVRTDEDRVSITLSSVPANETVYKVICKS